MKKTVPIIFLLLVMTLSCRAQIDTTTYAFQIGSKFILELIPTDSVNFKYQVLYMEKIDYKLDFMETEQLFSPEPVPGTIECIFGRGTEPDGPFKSVLAIRNNSEISLNYEALIAEKGKEDFYQTSVQPLHPGVRSTELWNDFLSAVVIHNIKKLE